MSDLSKSAELVLGSWIATEADDARDMGRRVEEVLSHNPRDHHYARAKMAHALGCVARAMTYAGCPEEQLLELLRNAHEQALRNTQSLQRELREAPEDGISAAFEEAG